MERKTMMGRTHVEKAAETGVLKISVLERDPPRYMLRSFGAGMFLSIVVFVF
jgi:nitrite transporter